MARFELTEPFTSWQEVARYRRRNMMCEVAVYGEFNRQSVVRETILERRFTWWADHLEKVGKRQDSFLQPGKSMKRIGHNNCVLNVHWPKIHFGYRQGDYTWRTHLMKPVGQHFTVWWREPAVKTKKAWLLFSNCLRHHNFFQFSSVYCLP